jgi:hypothetical protein
MGPLTSANDADADHDGELPAEGLTLEQFARWASVDRRALGKHLVDIPAGPVPELQPGQVPVRRIGKTRRVFLTDFRGDPRAAVRPKAMNNGTSATNAPSGAARASSWARSLDRIRDRRAE